MTDIQQELELYRSARRCGALSMRLDGELTLLSCNELCRAIFEYSSDELFGALCGRLEPVIHPDDTLIPRRAIESAVDGGRADWVMRIVTGEGNIRYALVSGSVKRIDGIAVFAGILTDITEQKRAEAELESRYGRELQFRKAAESEYCGIAIFDVDRDIPLEIRCAEAESDAVACTDIRCFFTLAARHVASDEEVRGFMQGVTRESLLARAQSGRHTLAFDYLRSFGGTERWMRLEAHLLRDPASGDLMLFAYFKDIDTEYRERLRLSELAQKDSMTGLLNHEATISSIERFLSMEGGTGLHAMFMIDLDNFKLVNDRLGHQRGDEVLGDVTAAIRRVFRQTDILGRIGGDEFLLLMKNASSHLLVRRKAAELVEALRMACSGPEGECIQLSASVGIALCDVADARFEELYASADAALYRCKNSGRNRYAIAGEF